MFGLSFLEIVVIGLVALLLLGPDKLPEAARTFGKVSAKFRKLSEQFRKDFYNSVYPPNNEIRKELTEIKTQLRSVKNIVHEEITQITKDDKKE